MGGVAITLRRSIIELPTHGDILAAAPRPEPLAQHTRERRLIVRSFLEPYEHNFGELEASERFWCSPCGEKGGVDGMGWECEK